MRTLVALLVATLRSVPALFRSQEEQAIVELALCQQLAIYAHKQPPSRLDRAYRGLRNAILRRSRTA